MEGVIKNAEETRVRSLNSAARLHEEYIPLKSEVDRLRRDCLGLERLPELHEEEGSNITSEYALEIYSNLFCKVGFNFADVIHKYFKVIQNHKL